MSPSEDPNDRLIDSLLKEQARGKPDQALLGAIASKLEAVPKAKSPRRNPDFFWPATAAAVVLLAAGGLWWNLFEKPDEEIGKLVEAPGLDPEKGRDPATAVERPASAPPEPGDVAAAGNKGVPAVGKPEVAAAREARQDPGPAGGNDGAEADPFGSGFVLPGDDPAELAGEAAGDLLKDLRFVRDESTIWYVQFGLESGGKWSPKFTGLQADGTKLSNRVSAVEMVAPGDVFFKDGAMAGRFKYLGIVGRDVTSPRTGLTQNVMFAQYEDLKPNKKGERYESRYGLPDAQLEQHAYHDRTAVMEFQGKEFKVEERTRFSLPPGGGGQEFFLKQVARDRIVIEFMGADGNVNKREIAR
jgi:hypothetical protein